MSSSTGVVEAQASSATPQVAADVESPAQEPKLKKSRTNTPWTPAEELRLKQMRDAGNSWSEIAKVGTLETRQMQHLTLLSLLQARLLICNLTTDFPSTN